MGGPLDADVLETLDGVVVEEELLEGLETAQLDGRNQIRAQVEDLKKNHRFSPHYHRLTLRFLRWVKAAQSMKRI